MLSYFAICFTDLVLDPETKSKLGYPYIFINSAIISVHLSVLMINIAKALIKKYKSCSKESKDVKRANKIKNGS